MDAFINVRRKKHTIITDVKDDITILELKQLLTGMFKESAQNLQLHYKEEILDESKTLSDYGMTSVHASPQNPAVIGLAMRMENGEFEQLEISPYSKPEYTSNETSNEDDL